MPKVSVIIPNYNHAEYLNQRIESVLNQTYQDFEVIILDDCSTDNSKEIIEQYRSHAKVQQILYNEKNSGSTFIQWEKGLTYSTAKWVWIAESDDYSDVSFLKEMILQLNNSSKFSLFYCRTMNVDSQGNKLDINRWADSLDPDRWNKSYQISGRHEINNYFLYRNIIPNASAVIFSKPSLQIFKEINNLSLKNTGDWLFWSYIALQGDIFYTSEILNFQRFHKNTTRYIKSFIDERTRAKECFSCITAIAKLINKTPVWRDQKYNWLISGYAITTSIGNKLNWKYWTTFPNVFMFFSLVILEIKSLIKRIRLCFHA